MHDLRSTCTRLLVVLAGSALSVAAATAASADTAPVDPSSAATPETVSVDALPTVQVDGVVWGQVVVGDTVYVAGSFTRARPAGSAVGSNEVVRNNALAYDIRTGDLLPWAPSLNAQALTIAKAPDGSRIYVGGDFTSVNGTTRSRIAALDPTSGALVGAFNTRSDAKVKTIAATASTVYFGGLTSNVGGVARTRVAAVQAADGALLPFAPDVNGAVNALVVSPDATQVVLGGAFSRVNGSSNPGYGLAAVDAATGASRRWAVNSVVRNAGSASAITSLTSDGDSVYGTGYVFGAGGNLEGSFRADWDGGTTRWIEDCHGDSYSIFARGADVYKASHSHSCATLGGFGDGSTPAYSHGLAFSKATTGTLGRNTVSGYASFRGQPAPTLQQWFPSFATGTVTGQNQAGWSVTGNSSYVVVGGEFPSVNGTPQQGLVRFAAKDLAPNKRGGQITGSRLNPTLRATGSGQVTVTWPSNWDQDNRRLTYKVVRDGNITRPQYTTASDSTFWQLPVQSWTDTGLVAGQTYKYRVFSSDPFGNETRSDTVTVTAR